MERRMLLNLKGLAEGRLPSKSLENAAVALWTWTVLLLLVALVEVARRPRWQEPLARGVARRPTRAVPESMATRGGGLEHALTHRLPGRLGSHAIQCVILCSRRPPPRPAARPSPRPGGVHS
jgi:hypothetical protein